MLFRSQLGRGGARADTEKDATPGTASRPFVDFCLLSGAELNRKVLVSSEVDVCAEEVVDDPRKVRAR